ncbi:MAG: hypothetical protein LBG06_05675 [Deltaproteobacteria bacterium]|nr:hypothetical protein [Deltaproteobacteria bacterium]
MLPGILSSGPAGSGPSGLELANEIDRLKDTLGKPGRGSRTSSSKPSADDPMSKGRMGKARMAGSKAKWRPGPKGHRPNSRPPLDEGDAEFREIHGIDVPVCPDCGGRLNHFPADGELVEQHENPPQSVPRVLHGVKVYVCEGCGHRLPTGPQPWGPGF